MQPMVEIKHLCKSFGPISAVDDVSFEVDRGDVLGFLGPNGAGKSTTMKMITGFLTPDSGTVNVAGNDVANSALAAKRSIGYLPEGAPLYGHMTPNGYLDFIAEVRGFRGAEKHQRLTDATNKVNLESVLDTPIETLSKGFKRRVGLAQAILHDPDVLILDEPTDGLDPNQKHEVRTLIRSMAEKKAIILSTHILEEVDAVCTRAIIIADGRVVADGTPAGLKARSHLHNAVTLSVRGARADEARRYLRDLSGVKAVETNAETNGIVRFHIYPESGTSLVTMVSQAARERGWDIEELHVERGRLDDVFRLLTTDQAPIAQ